MNRFNSYILRHLYAQKVILFRFFYFVNGLFKPPINLIYSLRLIVPGLGSDRIYIVDVKSDSRIPKLDKVKNLTRHFLQSKIGTASLYVIALSTFLLFNLPYKSYLP